VKASGTTGSLVLINLTVVTTAPTLHNLNRKTTAGYNYKRFSHMFDPTSMTYTKHQDAITEFLSVYDTAGPARMRRKRTVPWEGLQGAGAPETSQSRSTPQVEDQDASSSDQPDGPCQTPKAFLQTLTPAEVDHHLTDSLQIHRHDVPIDPSIMSDTTPSSTETTTSSTDMGTLGAIPHVTYIDRRPDFLADDVSFISSGPQTPRPTMQYIPWPVASRQPDFEYDLTPVDQAGRLEQLRLQRLVETSKDRFERLWGSMKAKTGGLEYLLRSQLREFRG
jgi:hypothetical protein